MKDKLKLVMYNISDGVFLYGDTAKVNLVANGVSPCKLFPIYNSLDYNLQKSLRETFNDRARNEIRNKLFGNNGFQIIFVGRLTSHKKIDDLISAVRELIILGHNVNLVVVGDGEAKKSLVSYAESSCELKNRIVFYGKTYDEKELSGLIMSSDLCVSPGEIGLTAMHVLAYGVPIVTHDDTFKQMPEFESVEDGVSGVLYKHGDFESLVSSIKCFINKPIVNVYQNCIDIIESKYTPVIQKDLIEAVLDNDLG